MSEQEKLQPSGALDDLHTWVINLDRDVLRLVRITAQLADAGLQWTRIPAVYGADLCIEQRRTWLDADGYRRHHGMEPVPGELGCYLSHLALFRAFLASSARYALVLEDDVCLTPALLPALAGLLTHAARWDMVKLSGIHSGTPQPVLNIAPGLDLAVMLSRCTGSSAYLVNRRAAQVYVDRLLPMRLPYDHVFDQGWTFGLKVRLAVPRPCVHDSSSFETSIITGGAARKFVWYRRLSAHRYRLGNEFRRLKYGLVALWRERWNPVYGPRP